MHSIVSLITTLLVFTIPLSAEVTRSPSLAPEDLGAFKWVIGATGGEGEVVVLRRVRTRVIGDKNKVEIYDSVAYDPGKL